jgi:hypothetical protein
MTTLMHRLQISLPQWQVQFLTERARREGVSVAEIIRQLVEREAKARPDAQPDSLWAIAGLAEDTNPLLDGIPVSENPELYLTAAATQQGTSAAGRRKASSRSEY